MTKRNSAVLSTPRSIFSDRTMLISFLLFFTTYFLFGIDGFYFGKTDPKRIIQLVNSSFDITCTINLSETAGLNSSYLSIHYDNYTIGESDIEILNATTIQYSTHKAVLMKRNYTCKLNNTDNVGQTEVLIGYKPHHVSDFKCRSYKWESMKCSFKDMYNTLPTIYKLTYRTVLEAGHYHECSLIIDYNRSRFCTIDNKNSTYLTAWRTYYFTLESKNDMGTFREFFEIDHYAIVIPQKASNFQVATVTPNSVELNWQLPVKLRAFPEEIIFRIFILSAYDDKPQILWLQERPKAEHKITINDLNYAFTFYNATIRMRVAISEDIEEMWSEVAQLSFTTTPKLPEQTPEVDASAFHINDNQDIAIYWNSVAKKLQNGPDFHYIVYKRSKNGLVAPIYITNDTVAKFAKLPESDYEFQIISANQVGVAKKRSTIRVPAKNNRLLLPKQLKKALTKEGYYFEWISPYNVGHDNAIVGYTVFWCVAKNEMPNQCEHNINFLRVDRNTTSFKLNSQDAVNFAVAANSANSTSGMEWVLCTSTDSNDIGKVKTIWISKMMANSIDLHWTVDCVDAAVVRGFNITYCPVELTNESISNCSELLHYKVVDSTHEGIHRYRIESLKPYTIYRVALSMFSDTRIGPSSDSLFNRTLESPPSAPLNLIVQDIKNTTVELHWQRPAEINGALMYYEIWFNHQKVIVEDNGTELEKSYSLTNLVSFTNYQILVQACTISCSEASNKISVRTEIGTPSKVGQPQAEGMNGDGDIIIHWQKPDVHAGHLEYYELKIASSQPDGTGIDEVTLQISGTHTSCRLNYKLCDHYSSVKKFFLVRPVNVVQNLSASQLNFFNQLQTNDSNALSDCEKDVSTIQKLLTKDYFAIRLYGEWSQPLITHCNNTYDIYVRVTYISAGFLMLLAVCVLFGYIWRKLNRMKNIKIILPEGMQDILGNNDSSNCEDKEDDVLTNLLRKTSSYDRISKKNLNKTVPTVKMYDKVWDMQRNCDDQQTPEIKEMQLDFKIQNHTVKNNLMNPFITLPSTGEEQACSPVYVKMLEADTKTNEQTSSPVVYATLQPTGNQQQAFGITPNPNSYVDHRSLQTSNGYVSNFILPPKVKSEYVVPSAKQTRRNQNLVYRSDTTATLPKIMEQNELSGYVKLQQLSDMGQRYNIS